MNKEKAVIIKLKDLLSIENLDIPESESVPTVANIKPKIVIIAAFKNLPFPANAATAVKPKTIKAK